MTKLNGGCIFSDQDVQYIGEILSLIAQKKKSDILALRNVQCERFDDFWNSLWTYNISFCPPPKDFISYWSFQFNYSNKILIAEGPMWEKDESISDVWLYLSKLPAVSDGGQPIFLLRYHRIP